MTFWLELTLVLVAGAVALAMRPWRGVAAGGPPWPWLAWLTAMPLFWGADHHIATPVAQPLSGACLLVLMMGWPLAVLALLPVAAATAWWAGLDAAEALHRLTWLGVVPATLALAFGAALRRWVAHHLFVYILGRGFVGAVLCTALAGIAGSWLHGLPGGLAEADVMLGRWLAAWADAWLCGMFAAIFVAFRPHWLATYADRIYLPPKPAPRRDDE